MAINEQRKLQLNGAAQYISMETDKQFYWFERSGHFPQWSESGRFNRLMAELATGNGFE